MTSLIIRDHASSFEETSREIDEFHSWCTSYGKISLQSWLLENGFNEAHLLRSGLIDFGEMNLPVSMAAQPQITEKGRDYIEDSYEHTTYELSAEDLWLVSNQGALKSILQEIADDPSVTARELEKDLYRSKFQKEAPLAQEELPFAQRDVIAGPYCDFNEFRTLRVESRSKFGCSWCGKFLSQQPVFELGQDNLCFRCQRIAYDRLLIAAALVNSKNLEKKKCGLEKQREWRRRLNVHIASKGWVVKILELFGQDETVYLSDFYNQNEEPMVHDFTNVEPTVHLHIDTRESLVTNMVLVKKRDNFECQLCGIPAVFLGSGHQLEAHHILPRAKWGKDYPSNLITLCNSCHDDEKWFGHKRAYAKNIGSFSAICWEWQIVPEILTLEMEELAKKDDLFKGENVIYLD